MTAFQPHPAITDWPPLTKQQAVVLLFVDAGFTNAAIAEALWLSVNTVKAHLRLAAKKWGVGDRWKLAELARERGVLAEANRDRLPALPRRPRHPSASPQADADRRWARRIRGGNRNLLVPLGSMCRILAGDDPAVVLAETFGPCTLEAVRQYGAGDGQVSRG